jgi:hypothetical protein
MRKARLTRIIHREGAESAKQLPNQKLRRILSILFPRRLR